MDANVLAILSGVLMTCCFQVSEEALPPRAVSCCTEVNSRPSKKMLKRVLWCEIQRDDGLCVIPAVVLHTKHRKVCANPEDKHMKKWLKKNCRNAGKIKTVTSKRGRKKRIKSKKKKKEKE